MMMYARKVVNFTVLLGEKGMQNVPNQRKCCTKREVGDNQDSSDTSEYLW